MAACTACSLRAQAFIGNCMLDWPLASQTSPTNTFLKVREFCADRIMRGLPVSLAFIALRLAVHSPRLSALQFVAVLQIQ